MHLGVQIRVTYSSTDFYLSHTNIPAFISTTQLWVLGAHMQYLYLNWGYYWLMTIWMMIK